MGSSCGVEFWLWKYECFFVMFSRFLRKVINLLIYCQEDLALWTFS